MGAAESIVKYEPVTEWVVSASQIDVFKEDCQRKWAWRYIAGIRTPQNASAALGSELHTFGEGYSLTGAQPDRLTQAGNLFIQGLPYLPPPGSGGVEGKIGLEVEGINYTGFIDLRSTQVPGFHPDQRVILDHKTSSNPKKYGLWEKSAFLAKAQPVLYAFWDVTHADDTAAYLRWLYYWTKGKARAKPSDVVLQRTELEDVFETVVHNPAKEIVRLKMLAPNPLELDPNTESCDKYGGCPYREQCGKFTTKQIMKGGFSALKKAENKMEQVEATAAAKKYAGMNPDVLKDAFKSDGIPLLDQMKIRQAIKNLAESSNDNGGSKVEAKEDKINAPEAAAAKVAPAQVPAARAKAAVVAPLAAGREKNVAQLLRAVADLIDGD